MGCICTVLMVNTLFDSFILCPECPLCVREYTNKRTNVYILFRVILFVARPCPRRRRGIRQTKNEYSRESDCIIPLNPSIGISRVPPIRRFVPASIPAYCAHHPSLGSFLGRVGSRPLGSPPPDVRLFPRVRLRFGSFVREVSGGRGIEYNFGRFFEF